MSDEEFEDDYDDFDDHTVGPGDFMLPEEEDADEDFDDSRAGGGEGRMSSAGARESGGWRLKRSVVATCRPALVFPRRRDPPAPFFFPYFSSPLTSASSLSLAARLRLQALLRASGLGPTATASLPASLASSQSPLPRHLSSPLRM